MNIKYFTHLDLRTHRLGIPIEQTGWRPAVGDLVVLNETSSFKLQSPNGRIGKIIAFRSPVNILVKWNHDRMEYIYGKNDLFLVLPVMKLSEVKATQALLTMAEFLKTLPAPAVKAAAAKTKAAPKVEPVIAPVAPSYKRYPTLDQFVQTKKTQAAIAAGTIKIKEVRPMKTSIVESIKTAARKNVNGQCDMAKQALTLEAARILNDTLVKVVTPKLPIMVRGYAKTALGKAVIANALNIAMEAALVNVPAGDARKKVAEAAVVMSYQEFLAGFKAEDLLAELFNTPALAAILGRLED